ncbi:carbohydrate ABC transporter membrane protein 1 (CUT1 family) [Salana multivorans]|uniref:Carbohydrate ABC transporter membrane protein 1 (CUT1 family) n=1 Tax=Salana multivorans TaxID=120377 RepID=A0A3N2DE62_9MICO|nr:sugar ABC transporter permease [Salana multivorans]OJX98058.1 MAG: hypothetical protein BGO96_14415 [Micrococcales bacterium 73-15]ROR97714.1 carbohydrate ABC transporter membrane protein 1 (CUT1 family) [Salana multivorans]
MPVAVRGRSLGRPSVVGGAYALPATVLLILFFIAPLAMTAVMSLFSWPLFGERSFIGVANYETALHDAQLHRAVLFTVAFAVVTTVVSVAVGLLLAMFLQVERRGAGVIRTLVFLPVVIGMATASFLWLYLLNGQVGPVAWLWAALGLDGTPPLFLDSTAGAFVSIVVMTVWKSTGFSMLLLLLGIQAIPQQLLEAASVDGAHYWQRQRRIVLPLLRPTFALVAVMGLTQNFLVFDQFFLMTRGGPSNSTITAVYWIYNRAFMNYHLGYGAALALLVLAVLVVVNLVQLRLLGRGGSDE